MEDLKTKKLLIFTHKECWADLSSPSGYSTKGGFPLQMDAISKLFFTTTLINFLYDPKSKPIGTIPIKGDNLKIVPIKGTNFKGIFRKISILFFIIPSNIFRIALAIRKADYIHCLVPGDLGMIGLFLAIIYRKKTIVRHCGTWGTKDTNSDKILIWILEKFSSKRLITLATGGGVSRPSSLNDNIYWIFSTTLTETNLRDFLPRKFNSKLALNFAFTGRITTEKNPQFAFSIFQRINAKWPGSKFHLIGEGEFLNELKSIIGSTNINDSVIFHGNLPNVKVLDVISKCDVFLFPTKVKEGFPKAVLEALAAGLIVFASAISVLPYLLEDLECGFCIDNNNLDLAVGQIENTLHDFDLINNRIANAQKKVFDFTLEKWEQELEFRFKSLE